MGEQNEGSGGERRWHTATVCLLVGPTPQRTTARAAPLRSPSPPAPTPSPHSAFHSPPSRCPPSALSTPSPPSPPLALPRVVLSSSCISESRLRRSYQARSRRRAPSRTPASAFPTPPPYPPSAPSPSLASGCKQSKKTGLLSRPPRGLKPDERKGRGEEGGWRAAPPRPK